MSELDQYDYDLPKHLIAQSPAVCRTDARLLVVDRQRKSLEHKYIRDLPEILRRNDCLVINDTRVVPARLVGRRHDTGGHWEGLFLAASPDGAVAGDVQDARQAPAGRYDHADQRGGGRKTCGFNWGSSRPTEPGSPGPWPPTTPWRCWSGWGKFRCRRTFARVEMVESDREALPDGLRPGAGSGGRADGRTALHRHAAGSVGGAWASSCAG